MTSLKHFCRSKASSYNRAEGPQPAKADWAEWGLQCREEAPLTAGTAALAVGRSASGRSRRAGRPPALSVLIADHSHTADVILKQEVGRGRCAYERHAQVKSSDQAVCPLPDAVGRKAECRLPAQA